MESTITKEESERLFAGLDDLSRDNLRKLIAEIVRIKTRGGKVVVITGSGPNIHEGVTTLVAELISKGIVDGVVTSSAVVAHEMAGALDRVKRVSGRLSGIAPELLPRGELFELSVMSAETLHKVRKEMVVDMALIERLLSAEGEIIIKAAGNMAYPIGLRTEKLSVEIESIARREGLAFEEVAGYGADEHTMIGAAARKGVPVLVSIPQLIGGGMTGLAVGDSIPLRRRADGIARMLGSADIIIESAIALSQEIHDGPFETYTGHGIWSAWEGNATYSLQGRTLARIDLDPALKRVWQIEREGRDVQVSIDKGLPKTKTFKIPFRMEMSGFARLEGSLPIIGDLGAIWPIIAAESAAGLGIGLDFVSAPQESERGREMREWIVANVDILDREKMIDGVKGRRKGSR